MYLLYLLLGFVFWFIPFQKVMGTFTNSWRLDWCKLAKSIVSSTHHGAGMEQVNSQVGALVKVQHLLYPRYCASHQAFGNDKVLSREVHSPSEESCRRLRVK